MAPKCFQLGDFGLQHKQFGHLWFKPIENWVNLELEYLTWNPDFFSLSQLFAHCLYVCFCPTASLLTYASYQHLWSTDGITVVNLIFVFKFRRWKNSQPVKNAGSLWNKDGESNRVVFRCSLSVCCTCTVTVLQLKDLEVKIEEFTEHVCWLMLLMPNVELFCLRMFPQFLASALWLIPDHMCLLQGVSATCCLRSDNQKDHIQHLCWSQSWDQGYLEPGWLLRCMKDTNRLSTSWSFSKQKLFNLLQLTQMSQM